ncbi:MAG: hypothetical protein GXO50_08285 [Chlorobi bacterium]|nr:hypothetical protein [Chlorobiota bacterium]
MKNILHYGLQRSGTNFLETLMLKNFDINIVNGSNRAHPLHKHFRLYDNKNLIPEPKYKNNMKFKHFSDYEKSFNINTPVHGILILSKDPYSWLISYKKWAKKCKWPEPDYNYIEEYNQFYGKWAEFSKQDNRIMFIRYIDLLDNADLILDKTETEFNLKAKQNKRIEKVKKVKRSKFFTKSKKNYYKNSEYLSEYKQKDLEDLNSKLNINLLNFLGYEIKENPNYKKQ